jgi:hypothetical protein
MTPKVQSAGERDLACYRKLEQELNPAHGLGSGGKSRGTTGRRAERESMLVNMSREENQAEKTKQETGLVQ